MIKLDLVVAISIFLTFLIFLVFAKWIFYTSNSSDSLSDKLMYLQVCPYCIFVFFQYNIENFIICPRCKSYIITEKEERKTNINKNNNGK
ncbi:MAG: hypothetical protein A2Y04_02655 [Omnitrophica WOR_2 bacterium GWC2_45_7]|nr:MAG: hypothetical protein A2Y04_02655 [Omnitrophica WOR_2 bacterium GWC2_45_7]